MGMNKEGSQHLVDYHFKHFCAAVQNERQPRNMATVRPQDDIDEQIIRVVSDVELGASWTCVICSMSLFTERESGNMTQLLRTTLALVAELSAFRELDANDRVR